MLDDHNFIPMCVRVIGFQKDSCRPFIDMEDPKAIPAFLLSFVLDNFAVFGWYFSDIDGFYWRDMKDEMTAVFKGDLYYEAAIATITHFRDTLATGGSPTDVKYPPRVRHAGDPEHITWADDND